MAQRPGLDPARLEPGEVVGGRYEIRSAVGHGGFGWVYRAHDRVLDETVALKFFSIEQGDLYAGSEGARREIRIARRISHPNVIRIHDITEADGLHFLSMEFVSGESLQAILGSKGRMPVAETLRIFRQIVQGVGAAHQKGVIHRDLKPGNILVDEERTAKVLDFGVAALASTYASSSTKPLVGTPEYMAPEQVEGRRADERSDIYALGVLLFEMLTGDVPFRGDTPVATALARLKTPARDPCDLNRTLPLWLGGVVRRSLEREPRDRFGSVKELLRALDKGEGEEIGRTTVTISRPLRKAAGRRPGRALLLIPLGALLLGAAFTAAVIVAGSWTPSRARVHPLDDGIVRILVSDFEGIMNDEATQAVAFGLPEAILARLSDRQEIRAVSPAGQSGPMSQEQMRTLGVEQLVEGRVVSVGTAVQVSVSVTDVASQERWLTHSASVQWDETFEGIDKIAETFKELYLKRLEQEARALSEQGGER
jgi:serine/threonine-protein kinase